MLRSRPTDATHNQCACYSFGLCLFFPPFDPAVIARPFFTEKARFSGGTDLPPSLAIAVRFSGDMVAKPLGFFGLSVILFSLHLCDQILDRLQEPMTRFDCRLVGIR